MGVPPNDCDKISGGKWWERVSDAVVALQSVQGWIRNSPSLLFSLFKHIKRESHPFPQVSKWKGCSPNSCTQMFSFFLGIWSLDEKLIWWGDVWETFLSFLRGKKFKNKKELAKGCMMCGGLSAIVLVYEPAFCLNPCTAASSCGSGITSLGCLSCSLWWTASHYCHTPWLCLMWEGYKYFKKKKSHSSGTLCIFIPEY